MNLLTKDMMPELLSVNEGTCISHAHAPHSPWQSQDPILFKKPVKNLKQSLLQKHSESEVTTLLEPFVALESDEEFWIHQMD
jgi:hypothetical protein